MAAAYGAAWAADWLCTDIEVRALRTRESGAHGEVAERPPPPEDTATDYEGHAHPAPAVRACLGRGPTLMVRAGAPIDSVHSRPPPADRALEAVRSL
ncbi:hypothetical protein GCM10009864_57790 [Streptomyces lunalinharesii]|uniref:Uncharacterized protein n=1 Tax=Streptomyces lunalinharesii TaxID=333384 RepID=A0ABN3SJB9_9ACTN